MHNERPYLSTRKYMFINENHPTLGNLKAFWGSKSRANMWRIEKDFEGESSVSSGPVLEEIVKKLKRLDRVRRGFRSEASEMDGVRGFKDLRSILISVRWYWMVLIACE